LSELDTNVGKILDTINDEKLESDTVVLFTSTNGPHRIYGREAGNCGKLRGNKGETLECGIRVPTILRWNNNIKENSERNQLTSSLDILPTFLDIAGIKSNVLKNGLDGKSLLKELAKNSQTKKEISSNFEDQKKGIFISLLWKYYYSNYSQQF